MSKKKAQLSDLIPEEAVFSLKHTGKLYRLRKSSLFDEAQINKEFGGLSKLIELVTKEAQLEPLVKVIYRHLSDADKMDFTAVERVTMDDNGIQSKEMIGGWRLLAERMDGGPQEIDQVVKAFFKCLGFNTKPQGEDAAKKQKTPPTGV